MTTKTFCDYCGLELSEPEILLNRQYNEWGNFSDACTKCSSKIKKINNKYKIKWESLKERKQQEINDMNKPRVETNKWWEFWK